MRAILVLAATLAALPSASFAYTLTPLTSFSTAGIVLSGPEGLAFGLEDSDLDGQVDDGVLYVSEGDSCSGNCTVFVWAAGATGTDLPLRQFDVAGLSDTRGLDLMPNGNLLLSSVVGGSDRIREVTRAGAQVVGGFDLSGTTVTGFPTAAQIETVVFRSSTSVLFGDEDTGLLYDINPTSLSFNGPALQTGLDDFSAMTRAENGLLFLADDSSGGGISLLRILDPAGGVLDGLTLNVGVFTTGVAGCEDVDPPNPGLPLTCVDPEGLAYDPVNRVLFIAFENEERVLSFGVAGEVPEPGTLGLLAAGLAGLVAARRMHRS